MKLKTCLTLLLTCALVLSCTLSSCTKAEPEAQIAPEEARMIELWDKMIGLFASMSAGEVTLTDIRTNMVDEPLDRVVTDGVWDELFYTAGGHVAHLRGRELPLITYGASEGGGETLTMPEYLSPLELPALSLRVHLPETVLLHRALTEGDRLRAPAPSDMTDGVDAQGRRVLGLTDAYVDEIFTALCFPVMYGGSAEDPKRFDGHEAEITYTPETDTLTLHALWTDNSYYGGSGVEHTLAITVSPDAQHAGQLLLSWEHEQTECEPVPYSQLVPTLVSTGQVSEWVCDASGTLSCTIREERVGTCMNINLLGDSMLRAETHAVIQTRLTPRESTVLSQTVEQHSERNTLSVGMTGSDEKLITTVTARGDGTYAFRMDYDVTRNGFDRYFEAVVRVE